MIGQATGTSRVGNRILEIKARLEQLKSMTPQQIEQLRIQQAARTTQATNSGVLNFTNEKASA